MTEPNSYNTFISPRNDSDNMINTKLYDLSMLRKMCDDDTVFIKRMITVFVSDIPAQIQNIKKGLTENNAEKIHFSFHRIKSSVKNICVTSLQNEVIEIEKNSEQGIIEKMRIENALISLELVVKQLQQELV